MACLRYYFCGVNIVAAEWFFEAGGISVVDERN